MNDKRRLWYCFLERRCTNTFFLRSISFQDDISVWGMSVFDHERFLQRETGPCQLVKQGRNTSIWSVCFWQYLIEPSLPTSELLLEGNNHERKHFWCMQKAETLSMRTPENNMWRISPRFRFVEPVDRVPSCVGQILSSFNPLDCRPLPRRLNRPY